MKCFVAIASLLGATSAEPYFYGAGLYQTPATLLNTHPYNARTYSVLADPVVPAAAVVAPAAPVVKYTAAARPQVVSTAPVVQYAGPAAYVQPNGVTAQQYHSQDEFGNYAYGYANQNSQKQEAGNVNLGVRGSYSYDAGHGLNRRVDYVADGAGFRVTGGAITPANSLLRFKRSLGVPATLLRTKTFNAATYTTLPDAAMMAASPAVYAAAPAPAMTYAAQPVVKIAEPMPASLYTAPAARITVQPTGITAMQHHAQDEFGNYKYGYANPTAQKEEQGNVNAGVTTGTYNYNVAPGLNRRVDYVADASGFRIVGNYINRMKRSLGGFRTYAAVPTAAQAQATLLRTKTFNANTYTTIPDAAMLPAVYSAAPSVVSAAVPVTYAAKPVIPKITYAAPASGVTSSQYHTQDEFSNYAYGYANAQSQKQEVGNANGVQGHYSFVDSYGLPRRVDYVADAYGFRASKHF